MNIIAPEQITPITLPVGILHNIPLADKTWFKTGGNARFFAEPTTAQEFAAALAFARQYNVEIFVLGCGANILISDEGFDGLVIHPQLTAIAHTLRTTPEQQESAKNTVNAHNFYTQDSTASTCQVTAGAGVTMPDLINYCLNNNILGLEEFSGIPGTVGGSVYINLHFFEFLLAQFIAHAEVIDRTTGDIMTVTPEWFNFGYNQSTLHDKQYYLVSATFNLRAATDLETAYARGRSFEIIRYRAARYPKNNTCGSFFRNFYPNEVTLESNDKKVIWVAFYLDKLGIKGTLTVGDAIISHQHANMLVNRGNATSADLINLARTMQELVFEKFGIIPQPECQLIGFKKYPLLTS